MEQIEKSSFGLLFVSVLVVIGVLSIYGLENYLDKPSLFIPPPEIKSQTSVNMVLEANSLEGLKKICTIWASQEDSKRNAIETLVSESQRIKRDNFIILLVMSSTFTILSAHIFFQVKKAKGETGNAL